MTKEEEYALLDLIEMSGQRVITVENRILKPLTPRFAINIFVRRWDNADEKSIYNNILHTLSEYFISNTRRDRIPQSDMIRLIEGIEGVDSVIVSFAADKNNKQIYRDGTYGIDEYGDVILERVVTDYFGNTMKVNDLYPLFRGGFTSSEGVDYDSTQSMEKNSAVNISFIGESSVETSDIINTRNISNNKI